MMVTFEAYPNLQASDSNPIPNDYTWKAQKTASQPNACATTKPSATTTQPSQCSQQTYGLQVGATKQNLTSKHKLAATEVPQVNL